MDYQTIKQIAKEQGIHYTDLIALAPQNDPFYVGTKGDLAKAHWFVDLWRQFGYGRGVHLRRIHYQIVSQANFLKANGLPYENTENDWNYLNLAAKNARYLGLVPARHFVDRRNPDPIIHAQWYNPGDWNYEDLTPGVTLREGDGWDGTYELPELPDLPDRIPDLPDLKPTGYEGDWHGLQQPYHVEVWAEKTTMNDVLIPLCRRYGVNLITGAGELSITAVLAFLKRAQDSERPARILYVSDYDPAGLGMPISIAVKVQFYQERLEEYGGLDVRLHPVVLTADQVATYNLPRIPVKDSDKRKANWIATQGAGAVELDALEALHPGELARIVKETILHYYDETLTKRAKRQKRNLEERLDEEWEAVTDTRREEIDELETDYGGLLADFAETRERFADLVAEFQPELDAYTERLADLRKRGETLYDLVADELESVDVDLEDDEYCLPEPELPDEPDDLLFDSRRGYFGQLAYYQSYREGNGNGA